MSQEDYDQGYEDGRHSRDDEIVGLEREYAQARADFKREREEVIRYRAMICRPRTASDDEPPF